MSSIVCNLYNNLQPSMSWVGIRCHVVLCIIFEAQNIIMLIFALNHSYIGLELAETPDSTYIRCDAHRKKCM
jgi:hypothetical protein